VTPRVPALATIGDPELAALHAYWTGKCGTRAMPRRADIDPTEIPLLLPHVFIAEIHQSLRFRFRLVGTAICKRWKEDYTGKWLEELHLGGQRTTVLEQYASVARTGTPRFDIAEFVNEQGRYLHYRRLLLPLSEDGHTPNMLLGGQTAVGIDGYEVSAPRWM
jgi:hypothetical protein